MTNPENIKIFLIAILGIIALITLVVILIAINNHFMWFKPKEGTEEEHWKTKAKIGAKNNFPTTSPKDKLWNRCSICGRFVSYKEIDNGEAVIDYTPNSETTIEQTNIYHKSCLADLHITNKKFNKSINTRENEN